jgi:hypothetical protein
VTDIDIRARIFPVNTLALPRVADDPTCQKMLQACAPLMRTMDEPVEVVKVDPI